MCCPRRVETGNTLSSPISERTKGRSMLIQRCQWVSTKPGMQIRPRPSITSAPDTLTFSPTAAMAPSRMWTAPLAKSPSRSSMVSTLAPRITISPRAGRGSARPDWAARLAGRQPMAPSAAAPSSTARRVKRWMVIGLVLPRKPECPDFEARIIVRHARLLASPAGLTRGSIHFARRILQEEMDCRVKPGNDGERVERPALCPPTSRAGTNCTPSRGRRRLAGWC